jgi:hypothetical protein
MTLKESMASDVSVFLNSDEFADTITYNGTEITAVFELQQDRNDNEFTLSGQAAIADVYVSKEDVATVSRTDKIVKDGVTYRFRFIADEDPAMWHLVFGGKETVL